MLTLQSPVPLLHIWLCPKISLVKASTSKSLPMKVILQVGQNNITNLILLYCLTIGKDPQSKFTPPNVKKLRPDFVSIVYVVHYRTEVQNLKLEFNLVEILLHRPTV